MEVRRTLCFATENPLDTCGFDIEKVREFGISNELDDEQIDTCLINALHFLEKDDWTDTEDKEETEEEEGRRDRMRANESRFTDAPDTVCTTLPTTRRYEREATDRPICNADKHRNTTSEALRQRTSHRPIKDRSETKRVHVHSSRNQPTTPLVKQSPKQSNILKPQCVTRRPDLASNSKASSCCRNCLRFSCWIVLLACAFVIFCYALSCHEPSMIVMEKHFQPYSYPVLRIVRKLTYPLLSSDGIADLYDDECLLLNPLFLPPSTEVDCHACLDVHSVHQFTREKLFDHTAFSLGYQYRAQPLVIKDAQELIATFPDLVRLYADHGERIEAGHNKLYCTDDKVSSLRQLLTNVSEKYIRMDTFFHAEWHTSRIEASQVLRQLFPRPYFLPPDSEVAMDKVIIIDAPSAQPYIVPRTVLPNVLYLQAHGTRQLELVPNEQCTTQCQRLSVTMSPGHVLYMYAEFWSLDSLPVFGDDSLTDHISVAYVSSFA